MPDFTGEFVVRSLEVDDSDYDLFANLSNVLVRGRSGIGIFLFDNFISPSCDFGREFFLAFIDTLVGTFLENNLSEQRLIEIFLLMVNMAVEGLDQILTELCREFGVEFLKTVLKNAGFSQENIQFILFFEGERRGIVASVNLAKMPNATINRMRLNAQALSGNPSETVGGTSRSL